MLFLKLLPELDAANILHQEIHLCPPSLSQEKKLYSILTLLFQLLLPFSVSGHSLLNEIHLSTQTTLEKSMKSTKLKEYSLLLKPPLNYKRDLNYYVHSFKSDPIFIFLCPVGLPCVEVGLVLFYVNVKDI